MKQVLLVCTFLMISGFANAAQPMPPYFELSFTVASTSGSSSFVVIGEESPLGAYIEERDVDFTSSMVYVSDFSKIDEKLVKGKFVLFQRDKKFLFSDMVERLKSAGASGVLVMNTEETTFTMGGGYYPVDINVLMISHSAGLKIQKLLLSKRPVQIKIPAVLEKTM